MAKIVLADTAAASVTTPDAGKVALFVDGGTVKTKDESGTVSSFLSSAPAREIKITINGDGATIATGVPESYYPVAVAGNITAWYITGSPSGSIVVDIIKNTTLPTDGNSMSGGTARPTLASATVNSNTDLSGWSSTVLSVGDILGINVVSAVDVQIATITLKVE